MSDTLMEQGSSAVVTTKRESLWTKAFSKFTRDKVGMVSLSVVGLYLLIAILAWLGLIAQGWDELLAEGQMGPTAEYWFGTNINGQDIFQRAIYSTKTAFEVGLTVAVVATITGALVGSTTGYFSGTWIDELFLWLMNCLDCIPYYLMVAAFAVALADNPYAMHIAMMSCFWMGTARLVRGEVIKLKNMEFAEAARSLGVPVYRVIFKHLLPNTSHILLVEMTLLFITAIKSEVILSFLGLGVKDSISWGLMIAEASGEVTAGHFCNFFAASGMLFVLVLAFNMFSDSLQDALDPRKI